MKKNYQHLFWRHQNVKNSIFSIFADVIEIFKKFILRKFTNID